MSKFKIGQKVYCINYGLGEVIGTKGYGPCPVECKFTKFTESYTPEGRFVLEAVNPTLLTLEEARAKGYDVPKQKIVKEKTVYINLYSNTETPYVHKSKEEAENGAKSGDGNLSKYTVVSAYPVTIKYEVEE